MVHRSIIKHRTWQSSYLRSDPVKVGKQNTGSMRATNEHAATPIGVLHLPKFHGPGLNLLPTKKTLMNIGMVKATKAAKAPMEKMAPMARGPPKSNNVMRTPITVLNHTALTGVTVCLLTRLIHQEPGKQPSRAYANVTREAATMHPWPMEKAQRIVKARMANANR